MKSKYLVFVGIGFELVGIILTCVYLGQLLEKNFDLKGLGLALLPMIGLVGWIIHVVQLTKKINDTRD